MPSLPASLRTVIPTILALFVFYRTTWSQTSAPSDAGPTPELELLFTGDELAGMRENAALPIFAGYWSSVLSEDVEQDRNFMREAFIYQMTGDAERGQNAKRLLLETADLEYWNNFVDGDLPLGFLQAGRLTAWSALAYDWLYDLLTEDERADVRSAIAEKGCVPLYRALYGFRHPESVTGWAFAPYSVIEPKSHIDMSRWPHILAHNNFRAIINGGLTLGMLVLDGHDDRVDTWKEIVLDSIVLFNGLLKDDGSYDEAVAYLNYAMTYEVYAMEAARRRLGADFFDSANFQGMIDYVLAMYLPSHPYRHGSLTFGDASHSLRSSTTFWVARNARDGLAQYVGLNYSDHDLFSLLYYDPTVSPDPPADNASLVELDLDWIVSRSGYELDDLVVGMRSGAPMNHEHGDRNSIQMKAFGEILLADHSRLTYWASDPEWQMRTSTGHNMVLIDGVGVQYHNGEEGTNESKSHAKIVRAGERPGYHFWASDATQGYRLLNADVESVTRSVVTFPGGPVAIVIDKVLKGEEPSTIAARWHVDNSDGRGGLTVGDGSFTITRPNARLFVAAGGDSSQEVEAGRFDSANKEHPYLFATVSDADLARESLKLTVAVPLRPDEPDPIVRFDESAGGWKIHVNRNGSVLEMTVHDRGPLPEFQVLRNDF